LRGCCTVLAFEKLSEDRPVSIVMGYLKDNCKGYNTTGMEYATRININGNANVLFLY
jgi:hypothetical protein